MRAILIGSRELAPDIRHFEFYAEGAEKFPYAPGQFVSLSSMVGEKKITRAYSIVDGTGDDNRFAICLNRVEDGIYSPHLFDLKPGEGVDMKGPIGTFVLRNPLKDSILVATGTGVAPMLPMLKSALGQGGGQQFTLIFGVRYARNLLYREEFEQLAAVHPNFRFLPTVTRPEAGWTGLEGRVQAPLLEAIGDRRDPDVYVCGLKEMVDGVREQLKELGFDRKQIIHEKYD